MGSGKSVKGVGKTSSADSILLALPRPSGPLISHPLREKRGTAFHRSAVPVISESSLKKPRLRSLLIPQFTGGDW